MFWFLCHLLIRAQLSGSGTNFFYGEFSLMARGLPVEDRLDEASNYGSWKTRVLIALEEYDVVDFAINDIPKLAEEEHEHLAS